MQSTGGGAITGRDYLSLLEKYKPVLQWEGVSSEHFFLYADYNQNKHAVFYPSLKSILIRLEEAQSFGTGISIWEIGQGLDYFFDLLWKFSNLQRFFTCLCANHHEVLFTFPRLWCFKWVALYAKRSEVVNHCGSYKDRIVNEFPSLQHPPEKRENHSHVLM